REELDLAAAAGGAAPADRAPGGHHLRVAGLRFVGAAGSALRREPEHLAWVRGRAVKPPRGVPVEGGDLLRRRASQQRGPRRLPVEPIDLALAAGADDQRAVAVEGEVVRRILARLPQLIPDTVRGDAIHGALRRSAIFSRGAARRRAAADVDD